MRGHNNVDPVRQALFERTGSIAERNPGVTDREVERVLTEIDAEPQAKSLKEVAMHIQPLSSAPVNERGGQRSYLLLGREKFDSEEPGHHLGRLRAGQHAGRPRAS